MLKKPWSRALPDLSYSQYNVFGHGDLVIVYWSNLMNASHYDNNNQSSLCFVSDMVLCRVSKSRRGRIKGEFNANKGFYGTKPNIKN